MYHEEKGVNRWRVSKAVNSQIPTEKHSQSSPGTIPLLQRVTPKNREIAPESSDPHKMSSAGTSPRVGYQSTRRGSNSAPLGNNNGGLPEKPDQDENHAGSSGTERTEKRRSVPGWPDRGRSPLLFPPPTVDGQPPRVTPRNGNRPNNPPANATHSSASSTNPSRNPSASSTSDGAMPPVSRGRWSSANDLNGTPSNNAPSSKTNTGLVAMSNETHTGSGGGNNRLRDLVGRHGNSANPPDGVYMAHKKGRGESPLVVYRSPSERNANPERLNLDKRHLMNCPVLRHEERVRLLNYQNNYIVNITNLEGLPNLIFLDLYNNSIEVMDDALGCVPTLRVLMLGKNRITQIGNLELLTKLDVLDLHSNGIVAIEGLSTLTELRVLNLAGNKIEVVTGVGNLSSLTELNVRRNKITSILPGSIDKLFNLQRIFMSNNQISLFSSVGPLLSMKHLLELTLDGNPIALGDPDLYRRTLLTSMTGLKDLDLKRISDADRKTASAEVRRIDEKRRQEEQQEAEELLRRRQNELRQEAILAAAGAWVNGATASNNTRDPALNNIRQPTQGTGLMDDTPSLAAAAAAAAAAAQEQKRPIHGVSKSPRSSGRLSPNHLQESTSDPSVLLIGLAPLDESIRASAPSPVPRTQEEPTPAQATSQPEPIIPQRPLLFPGDRRRPVVVPTVPVIQPSAAPSSNTVTSEKPVIGSQPNSGAQLPPDDQSSDRREQSREPSPVLDEKRVGFFEFEPALDQSSDKGSRTLLIYGEAWECFELGRSLNSVNRLLIKYVGAAALLENLIPKLDLFPRLFSLEFSENAIVNFTDLLAILAVRQFRNHPTLSELVIKDNPICNLSLLRSFVVFNLSTLRKFNGVAITDEDQSIASLRFAPVLKEVLKLSGDLTLSPHGSAQNLRPPKGLESASQPSSSTPSPRLAARNRRNIESTGEEDDREGTKANAAPVWKPPKQPLAKHLSFETVAFSLSQKLP